MSKLARWNGITDAHVEEWVFEKEAEDIRIAAETPIGVQRVNDEDNKPSVSWRDIWAVPVLRQNLWAAILLYCEGTFNFYLLTFYIKYFPGNLFVNNLYFACSDLCAFVLAGALLHYCSLKTAIRTGATIAFIGGVLYLSTSNVQDLIPIMVCFSRLGQSCIFNITLISVNKLFPTLFVANAYGIVNFCAHCFACLSPLVAEIKDPYPFSFFLAFVLVAIFSSFFLQEVS